MSHVGKGMMGDDRARSFQPCLSIDRGRKGHHGILLAMHHQDGFGLTGNAIKGFVQVAAESHEARQGPIDAHIKGHRPTLGEAAEDRPIERDPRLGRQSVEEFQQQLPTGLKIRLGRNLVRKTKGRQRFRQSIPHPTIITVRMVKWAFGQEEIDLRQLHQCRKGRGIRSICAPTVEDDDIADRVGRVRWNINDSEIHCIGLACGMDRA